MRVTFRLHTDDGATGAHRTFARTESVPYPHAPRVGEFVKLPVDSFNHMPAREVSRVIYALDGTVLLDINFDGMQNEVEPQAALLRKAGYHEV